MREHCLTSSPQRSRKTPSSGALRHLLPGGEGSYSSYSRGSARIRKIRATMRWVQTCGNLSKPSARFECKAHGAQEPQCTCGYMRIPSTAQRGNRIAQRVSRGSPVFKLTVFGRSPIAPAGTLPRLESPRHLCAMPSIFSVLCAFLAPFPKASGVGASISASHDMSATQWHQSQARVARLDGDDAIFL